jgi:hypothetical protein
MCGEVVSLTRRRSLPPGRFPALISVRARVDLRAIVRLEGLGKLKKIHVIGTWIRDFPACSMVPQPTTLPRVPTQIECVSLFLRTHLSTLLSVQSPKQYQMNSTNYYVHHYVIFTIYCRCKMKQLEQQSTCHIRLEFNSRPCHDVRNPLQRSSN